MQTLTRHGDHQAHQCVSSDHLGLMPFGHDWLRASWHSLRLAWPCAWQGGLPKWAAAACASVLPSLQSQGIGSQLIRAGLQTLRERGVPGVVVLGEPAYYQRFGFHAQHQLEPDGAPQEFFFALPLQAGGASALPQGSVQFHAAFA